MNIHSIYAPIAKHFRTKRMREFVSIFRVGDGTSIIDVGGTEFNWKLIEQRPRVLLVNFDDEEWEKERLRKIRGDGRQLQIADNSFDIAYSNSVIEHVGQWDDQVAFSKEIRRVAANYYVQTPNARFFIEPHLLAPFLHFLPRSALRRLVRYCSVWGLVTRPSQAEADAFIDSIRLLTKENMQQLFPDAVILEEKFLGFTKSLIAVRLTSPA
jgi:hypothetical protein